jgi:ABC-type glutathione transport system ATPase component
MGPRESQPFNKPCQLARERADWAFASHKISMSSQTINPLQAQAAPALVPTLAARNIGKAFGPITVLSEINVEFAAGEIHAVVGENGAGKSPF